MMKHISGHGYAAVPVDDGERIISRSPSLPPVPYRRANIWIWLPWLLTLIFASTNVVLLILHREYRDCGTNFGSFEAGFGTELAAARDHIEVVKTWFNGAPSFGDDGTVFVPNPDPVRYVGDPRLYPEVDENWENLIQGRYFRITETEAYEAFGDDYKDYWNYQAGGYVTGLEMFHTLHCLNHLRRAMYPEVYRDENPKYESSEKIDLHRNHCIEHLRQHVMCHVDLTPIPTKYFQQIDRNYVLSDVPHTCRSFEKVQTWMLDRYNGSSTVHSIWNRTSSGI